MVEVIIRLPDGKYMLNGLFFDTLEDVKIYIKELRSESD